MGVFLLRRAASSLSVLALSVVLVFMSIRILPGDPVLAKLGAATEVTPEALEALREEAGLNRPLLVQLFSWIGDAFRGDLGVSYFSQFPVTELVATRIPVTLEVTFFIIFVNRGDKRTPIRYIRAKLFKITLFKFVAGSALYLRANYINEFSEFVYNCFNIGHTNIILEFV